MLNHRKSMLLAGLNLAFILVLGDAPHATAQNAPADGTAANAPNEAIIVTGSRIRRDPLNNSEPIVSISSADIARTGLSSIADILQRLPGSGGGLNTKFNSSGNFGSPPDGSGVGAGGAEIDLRYLGSKRTLVLVDGLRWVPGSSGSGVPGAVDLNSIPQGLIERVEILQDGASAIYGSDAIGGVVNILTKKRQDGLIAIAKLGAYEQGDGFTQDYNISWGNHSEKLNLLFGINYVNGRSVSSGNRAISAFPVPYFTQCIRTCSSATPRGRFLITNPVTGDQLNLTLNPNFRGTVPRFDPLDPTGPNSDFVNFTTADRFNFAPFNYLLTPNERLGLFGKVDYEISDDIHYALKAVFNNRRSANQAAPIPLFLGPDAGNGNGSLLDTITVDRTNPYNPFGTTILIADPNNANFIGRRGVEFGPRHFTQNVNTWLLESTLDGKLHLGDKLWYWDANITWSRNRADQSFTGNVNAARLARALGPVSQCTAPCVPINIFGGPGSITQAQRDYVGFTEHDTSEQQLVDFTINFSGEIINLPAGPLGLAGGFEHRFQRARFDPDSAVAAGETSDIPFSPTSGSITSDEVYGEVRVPLLNDLPLAKKLEGSFAVRYSSYSPGGKTTTIKGGVLWQPVEDLSIRANYAEGFRAPTIGELDGAPSRFDAVLNDPCSDLLGLAGGTPATVAVRANCVTRGVPATGSYVQANAQISTTTGGSLALQPETSTSYSIGATFSPRWLRDFSISKRTDFEINYYKIDVNNAIQPRDAQVILNGCYIDNIDSLCQLISRTASGTINGFNNRLTNIGSIRTEGLDANFNLHTPVTAYGSFHFGWQNSFLFKYDELQQTTNGTTTTKRKGTERGSPDQAFPAWKATTTLDWTFKTVSLGLTGRYIGGTTEACPGAFVSVAGTCSNPTDPNGPSNRLSSRYYLDLQASWSPAYFHDRATFSVGVTNLTDSDPPACYSCSLNGFDPTTYDIPGRFGYIRVAIKI